jgi:hypothetical protein
MTATNSRKKIIIIAALVIISGLAAFGMLGFLISLGGPEPLRPATYPNGPGFQNAMIWLELAASKQEVFQVLGEPMDQSGEHIRQVLDISNKYDYCYMVLYPLLCLFIAVLMFYLNQNREGAGGVKNRIFYFCVFISIVMFAGDAMENVQLLKLTKYAAVEDIQDAVITALNIWTRVKWGAIFIYTAIMAGIYFAYFKGKKFPQILFVLAYGSTAILGIVSLSIMDLRFLVEIASYILALSWLFSMVHAGIVIRANINKA